MDAYVVLAILGGVLWASAGAQYVVPPATLRTAAYPEWAHYHWVWLSNDRANQSSMMAYAKEYLNHGIKIGAVDIDSGWSTGYNNFIFDTTKYPNASKMIEFFHSNGVRVILWATSMINTDSSNYQEAYDKGYMIRNILDSQHTFSWWHGKGGLLDYSNQEAVNWWHGQMDKALSLGIDGWKCDGTDPYILELVIARGKGGVVTRTEYSDYYYGDFFNYTRKRLGNDRLIMSRPVDGFGPIFLKYSPKVVMLSGWVGDDDPTFGGLESALKSYLQSAWDGYANFGSDIGGYRSGDGVLGRTKELLIRWAQLGAFSPLMENGGNKEHRPWKFDNETLDIYQKFVDVHYQLVPYLLTTGSEAYENGRSSLSPLAKHDSFIDKIIDDFSPPTYNYLLGKSILVAPIHTNTSTVTVGFPSGNTWVYWWDHSKTYSGGSTHTVNDVPLDEYPVFFANGTFLALRVTDQTPVFGGVGGFSGYLRWLLHTPAVGRTPLSSTVREQDGHGITATYWWSEPDLMRVNITAHISIRSLVHIAGLKAAPKWMSALTSTDGSLVELKHTSSLVELSSQGTGYTWLNADGCYCLVMCFGENGVAGHSIFVQF